MKQSNHKPVELKSEEERSRHFEEAANFIIEFAKANQQYGGYSHESDASLKRIIKALGLKGEIFATPSFLELALWMDNENNQRIYLKMMNDKPYNLAKLEQVKGLIDQVVGGQLPPKQALERLHEIESTPVAYSNLMKALAFMFSGAGFAVIIGASWLDVFFGGMLGLVTFGVTLLASRSSRVGIILELLAAAIVAFLAGITNIFLPSLDALVVTTCAVIWFVPGFGLTIAPRELMYGNTLSGIIYLSNALMVSIKLLSGTFIGISVARTLFPIPSLESSTGVGSIWSLLFVPLFVIGLAILFTVNKKNFGLIVLSGWLTWLVLQVGNTVGFWEGSFLGALMLTIFAKLSAKNFRISSATILLPVIMILVPGYAFLNASFAVNTQDPFTSINAFLKVITVIIAIIMGVFVGDAISTVDVHKIKNIKNDLEPKKEK